MGNGCLCFQNVSCRLNDVNLDSNLDDQIQNEIEKDQLESTNLYNLVKYFNESEKEINIKIEKKNIKKIISHKKATNLKSYNNIGDLKYELMLNRLLEQKKIERKGPKRRETLRKNNNSNFIKLVEEIIEENEKNMQLHETKKLNDSKNIDSKRESILLNYKDKKKLNHMGKSLKLTKNEQKKINNNFAETEINNVQILNEIKNLNDISNYISDAICTCMPK